MANGRHSTNLGEVQLPRTASSPLREVGRRVGFAVSLVVFVALIVLLGRDGYVDDTGDQIGFLDSLYYASVTVTTTGYGDITAVSGGARLATIALITPARIVFLILVVGTTVEVLTDRSRQLILTRRWRRSVRDHYVILGFGSTGASAAADLVRRGVDPSEIVAVDVDANAVADANARAVELMIELADQAPMTVLPAVADAMDKALREGRAKEDFAVFARSDR